MKTKKYKKKPQKKTKTRTSEKSSKTIKDKKNCRLSKINEIELQKQKNVPFWNHPMNFLGRLVALRVLVIERIVLLVLLLAK